MLCAGLVVVTPRAVVCLLWPSGESVRFDNIEQQSFVEPVPIPGDGGD